MPLSRNTANVVTYSDNQLVFSDLGVSGTCIVSNVHRPTLVDAIHMTRVEMQVITNMNMCCYMTLLIVHPIMVCSTSTVNVNM